MPAPPGFADLMNRKYSVQETQADASAALARANAANITASTPFENALRQAQSSETNQRARTLVPLSEASIRSSDAGAQEAGARSGYFGAEAGLAGAQTAGQYSRLGQVPDIALQGAYRTSQQTWSPGGPTSTSPDYESTAGGPISGIPPGGLRSQQRSVLDTPSVTATNPVIGGAPDPRRPADYNDPTRLGTDQFQFHNKGTANVKAPMKFAGGTSDVPAPGQTVTNGTWTPKPNIRSITGITGVPRPTPTPAPPATYAKGTSKVPAHKGGHHAPPPMGGAGPGMMSPSGPMGAPQGMPAPGQTMGAMPGPGASPPPGLPGLAGMLQAAMGADEVPGQGNQDSVPSMLTPGEAVVNKGGISHIPGGRQTIAKANAQGNADKAAGRPAGLNRGMVKKPGSHNVAVHIHLH
jgi:hypothetical protein